MTDDRRTNDRRQDEDGRPEEELRGDFRALRRQVETSGAVPDFETMMDRARAEATPATRPAAAGGSPPSGDAPASGPTSASRRSRSVADGRSHPRLGWWVPVAAAAAVVGLLLMDGAAFDAEADFERLVADYSSDVATWRSPTAELMDIPGVDLGSVPSIGSSLGGGDLPDAGVPEGRDS